MMAQRTIEFVIENQLMEVFGPSSLTHRSKNHVFKHVIIMPVWIYSRSVKCSPSLFYDFISINLCNDTSHNNFSWIIFLVCNLTDIDANEILHLHVRLDIVAQVVKIDIYSSPCWSSTKQMSVAYALSETHQTPLNWSRWSVINHTEHGDMSY